MSDAREVLADYEDYVKDAPDDEHYSAPAAFAALRAVLDVHAVRYRGNDRESGWCTSCHEPAPCSTLLAVSEALEEPRP